MAKLISILRFIVFLFNRRKFYLIPLFLALAVIALLLILAQNSIIAPFIYTVF